MQADIWLTFFTKKLSLAVVALAVGVSVQAQEPAKQDTVVLPVIAQGKKVTGLIADAATGEPLGGISVSYKDISAAITDAAGRFTLDVPGYDVSILATGEGFETREIALKGRSDVSSVLYKTGFRSFYDNVQMPGDQVLQSHLPGAAANVQIDGGWDRITAPADAYLQGKVAGLQAIRRSGTPNIGANLLIRGYSSLYATNQPLVVVDGVIFDMSDFGGSLLSNHYNNPFAYIDIRDIDNITVLKDGSSLYGTKGANGVILITTARARQEATRIDVGLYGGVNMAPKDLPVMDAANYRIYLSEMLQSQGLSGNEIQALPYMNDDETNPDYYRYHYRTNWQKQAFNNSTAKNGYLKITGGDNIARYALSIGFLTNEGVLRNTDLTRYSTRFNADFNLSKRLTANANLSFTFNEQRLKDQGIAPATNPIYAALVKAPFLPVHDVADNGIESPTLADADVFNVSNPAALIDNMRSDNKNYRFLGAMNFDYKLTRNISLATTLAITMDKVRESFFVPSLGVIPDTLDNAVAYNRSGAQVARLFSFYNDTRFAWNKIFDYVHQVSVKLGVRYNATTAEQDYGLGANSATDKLTGVGYGLNSLRRIGGSLGAWRWFNTYLSADYNLRSRYFLSFNMAVDGSSRFGNEITDGAAVKVGDNSYALMPSLAAAWLISSEPFMKGNNLIDLLKLRASVGLSGNDDLGNYTAQKYYVSQNLLGMEGLVRGNAGNPALQWEAVTKLNAGIDLGLLKDRLNISFDVYQHDTRKMIVYEPAPAASGMEYSVTNDGGMRTTGWETSVQSRIINHKMLQWDLGFTLAAYRSKITRLPQGAVYTDFADGTYITREGDAPNLFYGYRTQGVYASDAEATAAGLHYVQPDGSTAAFAGGDVRFVDMNGDKVINEADRTVIGDPNPDLTGSVNTSVTWQAWSLNALFTFSQGNDIYNYTRRQLESMSGYANQTDAVRNRWKTDGQQTDMPRAAWGDPSGNSRFSDRWIEDGSYFRLRTLSVSYNVPIKAGFVKYAVVYLTGNNLLTLTNYLGYDPEFSASTSMFGQGVDIMLEPQYRSAQLGIRLGL